MAPRTKPALYVALDFGTSHVKAVVSGASGDPISSSRRRLTFAAPPGGPDAALEFDPEAAWRLACEAVNEAVAASGVQRSRLRAIAVTSQRLGIVLYGRDGKPVHASPNRDARAVFQGGTIDADHGNELWQLTGHGPGMLTAWAKLRWFKEEAPAVYERVRTVSGIADWLCQRMTGVLLMESSLGVESGLALVTTGHPADGLSERLGVGEIDLAPTCQAGTVIGKLVTAAARDLGLEHGMPVVNAGPDTQAGLAGMGIHRPDDAGVVAGWSAAVQRVTRLPVMDDTHSMWSGRHVVPERWVIEGNAGEMGGAYSWLASMLCGGMTEPQAMAALEEESSAVEAGARGAAAYLGPTFVNISGVGLRTGGLLFPVPLAFEPADRGSLARAALESFAFAVRFNLDRLAQFGGPVKTIAMAGGMTRTSTFCGLVATTVGKTVGVARSGESATLGALSMAAAAAGGGSLAESLEARSAALSPCEPQRDETALYDDLYHSWRARERRLKEVEL